MGLMADKQQKLSKMKHEKNKKLLKKMKSASTDCQKT